ncbi:MAG: STAS domain-containing protein [Candidatus Electryoneaceae bacterium]|nr:STAS domain-containing protein [Candidatus Electryoneaceae bacterium]
MESEIMTIEGKKENNIFVFKICGWLNAQSFQKAENQLNQWLATDEILYLADFSGLDFISSIGLRVLLTMSNELVKRDGRMVIYGLQESVQAVFDETGIDKLIPISKSREEAFELLLSS